MKSKNLLFYCGVLPALFFQFIGAYLYFVLISDAKIVQSLYFGTKVLVFVWPAFWFFFFRKSFVKPDKSSVFTSVKLGVLSGLMIALPIFILYFSLTDYFQGFSANFRVEAESLGIMDYYILFAVCLSVFHALLEEYFWRWFVGGGLFAKLSKNWAAVVGSAAFASHHFIVLSQFFPWWITLLFGVAVGLGGAVWALLYMRTGRLLTSWISHFIVDASIMAIGYFLIF